MKTNITKTSCVRGIITFSEEEKEIFQEAYSLLERVIDLTTFLDNRKDDFDGYLSYGENGSEELFHAQEALEVLESLKNLEGVVYEYYEPDKS